MGFWCQRSGGWWRQLCLGEQMNLSKPLLEPSVDRSPLPLTQQQPLQRHEALVSSIANFIKCVRGHKCLHTHSHICMLLLQEEVFLSRSSRWSKLGPICASHALPLHSSHRAKHPILQNINAWQSLKNPTGHWQNAYRCQGICKGSIWMKTYSRRCTITKIFNMRGPRKINSIDFVLPWNLLQILTVHEGLILMTLMIPGLFP